MTHDPSNGSIYLVCAVSWHIRKALSAENGGTVPDGLVGYAVAFVGLIVFSRCPLLVFGALFLSTFRATPTDDRLLFHLCRFIVTWVCVEIEAGRYADPLVEVEKEIHQGATQDMDVCVPQPFSPFPSLNAHSPGLLNSSWSPLYPLQHLRCETRPARQVQQNDLDRYYVFGILTGIYLLWLIGRVENSLRKWESRRRGRFGLVVVDLSTRKMYVSE